MDILSSLVQIESAALSLLEAAGSRESLEEARVEFLGRKGQLTGVLRGMGGLTPEERPVVGQRANEVRLRLEAAFDARRVELEAREEARKLESERLDVTLPGSAPRMGRKHPLSRILEEVEEIMTGMGFSVLDGPEVETFYYNFASLNYPEDHPAMDEQDTFYLEDDLLLRTHTTAVQVRILSERKPPVRCVYPGRVHRRENVDLRHSHTFHQIDGLLVDEGVTFGDLKGTLDVLFKEMFGPDTKMRFRADFFPFTEPSAEFAFTCFQCHGAGCRLCTSGWIEFGGCGMVHPNILRHVGLDPQRYTGWAFGFGLDRVAMFRYGIGNIRTLMETDMRLLTSV